MKRRKDMNVLDLFCGCGGISEGFRLAGYKVVGGLDLNEEAVNTYSSNFPEAISLAGDILEFDDAKIKEIFGEKEVEVIVGGPPCQGFSNANRWQKENADWHSPKPVDTLHNAFMGNL